MTGIQAAAALISVAYGAFACLRRRQPLFFKILLYGMISYLFGTLFIACYQAVHGIQPAGFHVGYFGHIGCYFFLLSSYYGAMDRLADGGEKEYRRIRLAAAIPLILPLGLLTLNMAKAGLMCIRDRGNSHSGIQKADEVSVTLTRFSLLKDVSVSIARRQSLHEGKEMLQFAGTKIRIPGFQGVCFKNA